MPENNASFDRISALPLVESARGAAPARGAIREIIGRRELVGLLVRRELKARYKDSSLGFIWTLMRPLALLLVYFVAIGQFLGAARAIPDFGIFVFSGLTLWGLYSEIVSAAMSSIVSNGGLIKKIYLPREIFPLAAAGSSIVTFAVQLLVLLVVVVAFGRFLWSWNLVYALAGLGLAVLWGLAIGLVASAVNVYLRDTQYLIEIALMLFFWASPIVYSWSFVVDASEELRMPWIEHALLANPITVALLAFQRGLWVGGSSPTEVGGVIIPPQPWPETMNLLIAAMYALGVVALIVAHRVFRRLQGNFAQEM